MKIALYLNYALNSAKKDRFRKRLITAVCAGAVAFTAMCTGYMGVYMSQQKEFLDNISERQLVVYNHTMANNPFNSFNRSIDESEAEKLKGLDGLGSVAPVAVFPSNATLSKYSGEEYQSMSKEDFKSVLEQVSVNKIAYSNNHGKRAELTVLGGWNDEYSCPAYDLETSYQAFSYVSEEQIDRQCGTVDAAADNGVYLNETFAEMLGLTKEDLGGLAITFDIWVPVKKIGCLVQRGKDEIRMGEDDYCVKATITSPVRGICQTEEVGAVYLSADDMLSLIREASASEPETKHTIDFLLEQYNTFCAQAYPAEFPGNECYAIDWAPNAYYLIVEDASRIESIKTDIAEINSNFKVYQVYQNVQAGVEYLTAAQNSMLTISLAVLGIVLLLIALIYVSLIDKRKYEFAVLRANGMTKREVRKIIYFEMGFQFVQIFIIGIVLALLIYLIAGVWLGYPFQFNGMTALWIFVISLGSVILPTIVSLLFVNKFEPDKIMRN